MLLGHRDCSTLHGDTDASIALSMSALMRYMERLRTTSSMKPNSSYQRTLTPRPKRQQRCMFMHTTNRSIFLPSLSGVITFLGPASTLRVSLTPFQLLAHSSNVSQKLSPDFSLSSRNTNLSLFKGPGSINAVTSMEAMLPMALILSCTRASSVKRTTLSLVMG